VETLHTAVNNTVRKSDAFISALENEIGRSLAKKARRDWVGLLVLMSAGPSFPKKGEKAAWWRDILIICLRLVLAEEKVSLSLSYSDSSQTTINRPFARCIEAAWNVLPASCRGSSASALIARARTWRAIPVERFDRPLFEMLAHHGLKLLEIVEEANRHPISSAQAMRKIKDAVARGEIRYKKPANPTLPD
jgi:hypothetical protein